MNISRLLVGALLSAIVVAPAQSASQRTFVSTQGVDNPTCSVVAPCRTFATAITATMSGGEVIVLDSGGYGAVTIAQSVSIIAPAGVYAGISVATGTGVTIAQVGIKVVLRGLTINSTGGLYGIWMTNGAELKVEDCVISNFTGSGVLIQTAAAVKIAGVVIADNAWGIAAGYGATVDISNSRVTGISGEGVAVFGGPSGKTTNVFITDSLFNGDGLFGAIYCIDNLPSPGATGNISATRVTVTNCGYAINNEPGIPGATGTVIISNSMVTGSYYGLSNHSGGTFRSLGNNHVSGNLYDTLGIITTIAPK